MPSNSQYSPRYVAGPLHKRTMRNRAVDWVSGEFPSFKKAMDYRMVRYDGMLSHDFLVLQEADPNVVAYWEKPGAFRWTDGVRWRDFAPTYAVDLADTRRIAIQITYLSYAKDNRLDDTLPFVRRAGLQAGYHDVEIWTEREIRRQPALANAELMASERTFTVDEEKLHRVRVVIRALGGRASVRDLRLRCGIGNQAFRSIVRLVAFGELRLADPVVLLDDNAVVETASGGA